MLRACRNKLCTDKPGCLCDGNSGSFLFATPTPGPGGSGNLRTLLLTVASFTDSKRQTNLTPTISGTAEPDSKITITVYPDGIGGEVYAAFSAKGTLVAIGTWPTPELPHLPPRWIVCYIPVPDLVGAIDPILRHGLIRSLRDQQIISQKLAMLAKESLDSGF